MLMRRRRNGGNGRQGERGGRVIGEGEQGRQRGVGEMMENMEEGGFGDQ